MVVEDVIVVSMVVPVDVGGLGFGILPSMYIPVILSSQVIE